MPYSSGRVLTTPNRWQSFGHVELCPFWHWTRWKTLRIQTKIIPFKIYLYYFEVLEPPIDVSKRNFQNCVLSLQCSCWMETLLLSSSFQDCYEVKRFYELDQTTLELSLYSCVLLYMCVLLISYMCVILLAVVRRSEKLQKRSRDCGKRSVIPSQSTTRMVRSWLCLWDCVEHMAVHEDYQYVHMSFGLLALVSMPLLPVSLWWCS